MKFFKPLAVTAFATVFATSALAREPLPDVIEYTKDGVALGANIATIHQNFSSLLNRVVVTGSVHEAFKPSVLSCSKIMMNDANLEIDDMTIRVAKEDGKKIPDPSFGLKNHFISVIFFNRGVQHIQFPELMPTSDIPKNLDGLIIEAMADKMYSQYVDSTRAAARQCNLAPDWD